MRPFLLYSFSLVRISEFLNANFSCTCVRCTHLLKSWRDRCLVLLVYPWVLSYFASDVMLRPSASVKQTTHPTNGIDLFHMAQFLGRCSPAQRTSARWPVPLTAPYRQGLPLTKSSSLRWTGNSTAHSSSIPLGRYQTLYKEMDTTVGQCRVGKLNQGLANGGYCRVKHQDGR